MKGLLPYTIRRPCRVAVPLMNEMNFISGQTSMPLTLHHQRMKMGIFGVESTSFQVL